MPRAAAEGGWQAAPCNPCWSYTPSSSVLPARRVQLPHMLPAPRPPALPPFSPPPAPKLPSHVPPLTASPAQGHSHVPPPLPTSTLAADASPSRTAVPLGSGLVPTVAATGIAPAVGGAATAPAGEHTSILDNAAECTPWLAECEVAARRARLGLDEPTLAAFAEQCEFISLGNFCGVARGLQALGLKRRAYPFDWVRSPLWGVMHCLETDFEDFLTFTNVRSDPEHGLRIFQASRWGGSFWHHNPSEPNVKASMVRRIERLLGLGGEDQLSRPRVFVRAANSTQELEAAVQLHDRLAKLLPEAGVYLLVLVDFQLGTGPLRLEERERLLFYRLHESSFAQPWSMQRVAESYAEAIVAAVRLWIAWPDARAEVPAFQGVAALMEVFDQFDGGNPASDSFWPRRWQGQQISLRGSKARMPGLLAPAPSVQKHAPATEVMQVRVPEGVQPGALLHTEVFGRKLRFPVPEGASTGQLLQLRLAAGGIVTTAIAAAAATATAAAAAAAAGQQLGQASSTIPPEAALRSAAA